ncbi:MAG: hypothetical protein LC679_17425 [Intrasporangiaceae bacterium]|nr:hypothetical protein [Intrasporangiaceae bacterium]
MTLGSGHSPTHAQLSAECRGSSPAFESLVEFALALSWRADGIGSIGMDADQPGLFDLPGREVQAPAERRQRGKNREVWTLTATAEVAITDASALLQAAARLNEGVVVTVAGADLGVEDSEPEAPDAAPVDDAFDALAWLIWPDEGLQEALDAGALRILSVESEATADAIDHETATWKVAVKLTDVNALRRLAAAAYPDDAEAISASLAIAWQRAADPFTPLRSIDGITWKPGPVIVEHLPARTAGSRGGP